MTALLAATDHLGNPEDWSSGLGQGLMALGFFGGIALCIWVYGKYM